MEFAGFRDQGYRIVKGGWGHDLDIAFGRDETRDLAIAHAVRDAIGPDVDMICDVVALAGWTPSTPSTWPADSTTRSGSTGSRIRWSSRTSTAIAACARR